jgi:hypothetical protein
MNGRCLFPHWSQRKVCQSYGKGGEGGRGGLELKHRSINLRAEVVSLQRFIVAACARIDSIKLLTATIGNCAATSPCRQEAVKKIVGAPLPLDFTAVVV